MPRLQQFPLLSREQLLNSPSRADGVPENMEHRRRRLAAQHMMSVCANSDMRVTTWAIAVTFFNRFYTRKSMKKNNSFIVACAALYLAGKVENEPRSHKALANELLKAWYGRDNPQLEPLAAAHKASQAGVARRSAQGADPLFFSNMWAAVLEAERALLYTIGFDFNVDLVHTHLGRLLKRPRLRELQPGENKFFQNKLIGIANDIYRLDGTLALQYSAEKIALAALYFIFKAAKANKIVDIPQPRPGANGTPWYVEEGLSTAECVDITSRFTERVYSSKAAGEKRKHAAAAAGGPPPSAAATTGCAASTVMLGACESVAYSGGAPAPDGGATGGRSEAASGADAPGEHTSVARPLSSEVGSGSVPSKRGAAAEGRAAAAAPAGCGMPGDPSKRARGGDVGLIGANEATSAAMPPPASRQPGHSPLPAAARTARHTAAAPARQAHPAGSMVSSAPACPPGAPAAGAPAAVDSDKEEGELEEGELS